MRVFRLSMVSLAASLLLLGSCTENPAGPSLGSGTELEATVNGQKLTLTLTSDFNTYDPSTKEVRFGGTLVGNPSKTITARFNYDLAKGPFPHTMSGDSISINYIEASTSGAKTYDCPIGRNSCSITITASNGEIVAGTFRATLAETADTTKTVQITDGTFSVKLKQQ